MQTRILVVDDEADLELLVKHKFRRKIREGVYAFAFVHNGEEALEYLHDNPAVDIVLSDIRMPVMDGLTLLARLAALDPVVKTVMVSAYGDMANIRTAMNHGAFDFVCKPVDFVDLELTIDKAARHVAQLRQTLRAIQENSLLRMYVDDTVLSFVARPGLQSPLPVGETLSATVLFVAVCNFTALAEVLPPTEVVALLNACFDKAVPEITAQGGHVDKFIGDTIMAVFRGNYHLDRAIDAALAMRAAVLPRPSTLPAGQAYQPVLSIGLNSGEMVAGHIGSASLKRFSYTVIGDVVSGSQRLQVLAEPGQILLTAAVYEQVKESFQCQLVPNLHFQHQEQHLPVYQVLA